MRIPKSFKLFSSTITVVYDNERLNDLDAVGLSEIFKFKITLSSKRNECKISEDSIMDTFYHEKVHMILDNMERCDLSKDEQFVDVFAKLLRQSEETAEY
jgi:hypothetical protein